MSERKEYANGEFCWVELISPDVQAAASFYGDLLGWEPERYEPDPEGYWYLRHADKLVAGLEGIRMEGQVPAWLGYVNVDDVRTTAGKVGEAGGTVLDGPLEVPGGAGSLAVCQDPDGAVFALWQSGQLSCVRPGAPGRPPPPRAGRRSLSSTMASNVIGPSTSGVRP